jgi:Zn finger protein HypA/HybF involved in hydrogenase expression
MSHRRGCEETHQTFSQDEFDASMNLVDCEDCGTEFNLGVQPYFGPRCPSCRQAAKD